MRKLLFWLIGYNPPRPVEVPDPVPTPVPPLVCLAPGCRRTRGNLLPLCYGHFHILHPRTQKRLVRMAWCGDTAAYRQAVQAAITEAAVAERRQAELRGAL